MLHYITPTKLSADEKDELQQRGNRVVPDGLLESLAGHCEASSASRFAHRFHAGRVSRKLRRSANEHQVNRVLNVRLFSNR